MATAIPFERFRFGVFEVDLRSGELRKQGIKIKLHDQPFQILAMLVEHPGEVVTREQLQQRLWPADTFVDFDRGLNSAVKKLRDALGDSAEIPRYVETLPRRGYRFIGSLSNASTSKAEPAAGVPGRVIEEKSSAASEEAETKVPAVSGPRSRWMLWAPAAALVSLLVLLVGFDAGSWREKLLARATPIHIRSIAVLPLENLSGDPAQEYFTDGMTDALITNLAQISSLKVISRTSVIRYKGTKKTLPEIGRELNVDGVVEGAVVRSGERVRVDAQLIEVKTDRHLWASSYERNLGDVIVLQNDIARAVANEVQVKLTPQEQAHLQRADSVDPQAYESYLRGRYFWNKGTDVAVRKSIDYFQQAIQRDPNYPLAYAGMAEAYIVRGDVSPEEKFSKAKATAKMALQMDDGLAEAHNAMAMSLFRYDWDWRAAESEFQRALALNPNYAQAHQWYGQYLRAMGRQNSAMAEIKRAQELDPLGLMIGGGSGQYGTQYDLMIESNRRKLELDANFAGAYLGLGRAYALKGMYQDAIAAFQKGLDLSGGAPHYLSFLGYTYGVWGKRNEARKILLQLNQLSKRRYVSPYEIGLVYIGLGEKDMAFDWLQKAVADRSIPLVPLKAGEEMASLRSDPRYAELLSRIGLPQ
ncbi:MAG TPA: winged helix-turn-helix domain-containing protein [Terriglobales bacterium]|nr:winged helix-turn-helix domain-containing protein [Terriglobales bacterium]